MAEVLNLGRNSSGLRFKIVIAVEAMKMEVDSNYLADFLSRTFDWKIFFTPQSQTTSLDLIFVLHSTST